MSGVEADILAEARRQLDQQFSELGDLRSRAAGVLGAAGVIAGLFVGRSGAGFDGFGWAALALLMAGALAAVYVLIPHRLALGEDLDASLAWYRQFGQRAGADELFQVSTAANLAADRDANRAVMHRLGVALAAECALLAFQLLLWVLSAAVG